MTCGLNVLKQGGIVQNIPQQILVMMMIVLVIPFEIETRPGSKKLLNIYIFF
jgi:hypothetical protein